MQVVRDGDVVVTMGAGSIGASRRFLRTMSSEETEK